MKRAIWMVGLLAVAVTGCTTVQVNPLAHELNYQLTPTLDVEKQLAKSIAIVAFDDGRMYDGKNVTTSPSKVLSCIPIVSCWYLAREESHPEVTHNTTKRGACTTVKAAGTLNEAVPQLLAKYLSDARRFSKVQYVEPSEAKAGAFDFVLRGTLKESKLVTRRYSYFLGFAAIVPHLLGAPVAKYEATLTVEWQLYTADGKPFGPRKQAALVEKPIKQWTGLYYGNCSNEKAVPLGLYVAAVRDVNKQIADDLNKMLFEK